MTRIDRKGCLQGDAHSCERVRINGVCQIHRGWRYMLNTPKSYILLVRCSPQDWGSCFKESYGLRWSFPTATVLARLRANWIRLEDRCLRLGIITHLTPPGEPESLIEDVGHHWADMSPPAPFRRCSGLRNILKESTEVKSEEEEIQLVVYKISAETLIEKQIGDKFGRFAVEELSRNGEEVLKETQDEPRTGRNFGLSKTLGRLRERYFVNNAEKEISRGEKKQKGVEEESSLGLRPGRVDLDSNTKERIECEQLNGEFT
ncbi:hypothetical protein EVAR_93277_1 [Eumeta japonica]|uniref:Uncharacterized protein n=1 Tax=Eumeta variegata TaxID=151549 RepID=A0A4C1TXV1_EUMVA|nr:hypothetical protein EVAR_93277_1 [Eumeta japonica]